MNFSGHARDEHRTRGISEADIASQGGRSRLPGHERAEWLTPACSPQASSGFERPKRRKGSCDRSARVPAAAEWSSGLGVTSVRAVGREHEAGTERPCVERAGSAWRAGVRYWRSRLPGGRRGYGPAVVSCGLGLTGVRGASKLLKPVAMVVCVAGAAPLLPERRDRGDGRRRSWC
jgi:hypothetical protein